MPVIMTVFCNPASRLQPQQLEEGQSTLLSEHLPMLSGMTAQSNPQAY